MENQAIQDLKRLIESRRDIVNFGTAANAIDSDWILKAENILGRKLSDSYKWFLRNYSGGEIGGEEIYSIYGIDFDSVNGGDIVFQHLVNQKNKLLDPTKVAICETDLDEVFCFDYNKFDGVECPICLRLPSGSYVPYAANFFEFLQKRINAHST